MGEVILLPTGRFPRLSIAAALLVALLLFLTLLSVHSPGRTLLYSNSLDLVIVLLASFCCFFVARSSSGYFRQIWMLLAIAFALEIVAQAISTFYQSFVPGSSQVPWPSDVLYFVWAAPVFMIFLPRSDDDSAGIDSLRLLDFLQVAIVAGTIYLYFFYSPARWQTDQLSLLRQILVLYIARDLILSATFFFRTRSTFPSWLRSFSLVMAFAFLAAVLSDADYLYFLTASASVASWGDLLFVLPYVIVIFFAVTWKQPEPNLALPSRVPAANPLSTQILVVGMPLLVIFMAHAIAREHFLFAWLAVAASFLCSALRLILTNRRQRRISDELLAAEKALHHSELMFSSVFRSSPDAFTVNVFPDGPFLDVNEGFTRMTGYTREEVINRRPQDLNLWVYPSRRAEVLSQLTTQDPIRDVEFLFRTKAGILRTGQLSASLLNVDNRTCVLVVVRDITVRREAEDILRTSEERFRSFIENLHVGILSYDLQGRLLFANQAVVDLFGAPLDRMIGKNTVDLGIMAVREDGSLVPPDQRPIQAVIASRKAMRSQLLGWQLPNRSDTIWTLLDAVPEFTSTGELNRILVSFTDLTEQRRALDALRESEERFRTLVRDLHVAVVLNGPDGKIEFANQAALDMFGVTNLQAIGEDVSSLGLHAVDENGRPLPMEDRPVPTVLHTKRPLFSRTMGWRRPGVPEILWIFGNAVPQFNPDGSVLRVISSFTDITEMKNAEQAVRHLSMQLLKLQDEERRRIGRELHDGLAQTVLAINLSLAQVRDSIQPLKDSTARSLEKARALLQQMSREIRTLSYLLHPPLLDDLGLVSALKEYTRGFGERSGIDTQIFLLSDFKRLPQDVETALFRIVQESLANIQRHSGSTTARIRLFQDAVTVTLEVIDSGHGMKLPGNGDAHPQDAHFGVGIPGMRERVALLGGHLIIDSNSSGTTVRAFIPTPNLLVSEAGDDRSSHSHRG